jgi:hypothetical protein
MLMFLIFDSKANNRFLDCNRCGSLSDLQCFEINIKGLNFELNEELAIKDDSKAEMVDKGQWDSDQDSNKQYFIRERSNIRTPGASCPPNTDGHGTYLLLKDWRSTVVGSAGRREVCSNWKRCFE